MPTGSEASRRRYRREAEQLARIGAAIQHTPSRVHVEIPLALAEAAIEAWDRDDHPDTSSAESVESVESVESPDDRLVRHRAGSLALIGLVLVERGQRLSEGYLVDLDAWFIGHALDAADDEGLIVAGPTDQAATSHGRLPGFVNIDLELSCRMAFTSLQPHLEEVGLVLRSERENDRYVMSFELADNPDSIIGTAGQMLDLIESLPQAARTDWDRCTGRVLNIGLHSGLGHHQPVFSLSAELLNRAAAVGAAVEVTFYPHHNSTGTFRHHRLE